MGKYRENESSSIAEEILKRNSISHDIIEQICRIIENHQSAKDLDTTEFRILWDAGRLVDMSEVDLGADKQKQTEIIDQTFKTQEGRRIATKLFLT